ncbi:MAG: peptide chain release factor N(5)-glutamine methyltransferase [Vicinamibacteria bacterium]|nr:peptide chain release factor N(5)-glutamine methyltransferase [Vicinamibacteria bacterium]
MNSAAAALREAAARLRAAGVRAAEWDAELLLRHVLGWSRADLVARSGEPLPAEAAERFGALVERRAARLPLQHLTGVQAFWRHEFLVTPEVLIPRPETELLVERALDLLPATGSALVVDVGTGSGCLALSIAAERPPARVWGLDLSPAALEVARRNAVRLGLEARVDWRQGDLLVPVDELHGQIDLIVSNPPYVDPADPLEPEVRDHEPALALFPPGEPLSVYRRLWPQVAIALRPGGRALVEVGAGQANAVADLAHASGLVGVETWPDLQGIPRVVGAARPR